MATVQNFQDFPVQQVYDFKMQSIDILIVNLSTIYTEIIYQDISIEFIVWFCSSHAVKYWLFKNTVIDCHFIIPFRLSVWYI